MYGSHSRFAVLAVMIFAVAIFSTVDDLHDVQILRWIRCSGLLSLRGTVDPTGGTPYLNSIEQ